MADRDRPTIRVVSGGAPGLGKRSSRWFDPSKAGEEFPVEDDGARDEGAAESADVIEMIDTMLKGRKLLTPSELKWVERIDRTVARFEGPTQLTPRQREVIADIFEKYRARGGRR